MSTLDSTSTNKINSLDLSRLVSVTQAAALSGLSNQTIYKLIKRGSIKVYGHPKCYRVLIDDIISDKRSSYNYLGQPKTDDISNTE